MTNTILFLQTANFWDSLWQGVVGTIIFAVIGLALSALGYVVIDWLIPGKLGKQIAEDKNVAIAIVAAAMILGICIIIAASIAG